MLSVPPALATCVDSQVPGCHWPGGAHLGLLPLPTVQVQNHTVGNIQQPNQKVTENLQDGGWCQSSSLGLSPAPVTTRRCHAPSLR